MRTSSSPKRYKIAACGFDYGHAGSLLKDASVTPGVEIVALADPNPANAAYIESIRAERGLPASVVYTDYDTCLRATRPDIVIICPTTGRHGELAEKIAPHSVHLLIEKPFAATLAEADRILAVQHAASRRTLINWPLAWYPPHLTTKRLLSEGLIGDIVELHYYDGNRGPSRDEYQPPGEDPAITLRRLNSLWHYTPSEGGGSLLDYLGYGVTLATWFLDGVLPIEVTTTTWNRPGLSVDEQSVSVCRYARGLSTYQTRWGTFTDPWIMQCQPRTGFVLVGTRGTIASFDYAQTVRVQTADRPEGYEIPVDTTLPAGGNPVAHFIEVLENRAPLHPPLSPEIGRAAQRIVEAARLSAARRQPVRLSEVP